MFGGVNHLNMASIGHHCIMELVLVRCYWLLRRYTAGNWGKVGPREPSHRKIRQKTDPSPIPVSQIQMANTAFLHDVTCAVLVSQKTSLVPSCPRRFRM